MAIEEHDPIVENWLQLAAERGWDAETTAAHLDRSGSPDLAAHLRAKAGIARAEAAQDDDAADEAAPAKRAPRGRRSAARADETA